MAKKKDSFQLLIEVDNDDNWNELLSKNGLIVIDVYQDWCGPCEAIYGIFKRIKNELADDLLTFAKAKADTISALKDFRGKCEPRFLFIAGKELVNFQQGVDGPKIIQLIHDELNKEHEVISGNKEREAMSKPPMQVYFELPASSKDKLDSDGESLERKMDTAWPGDLDINRLKNDLLDYVRSGLLVGKQRASVALIKPDAVKDGLVKQIKKQIRASGLHIIAETSKKLTKMEAIALYSKHADKEYFDELTTFMSSGPAHILVLVDDKASANLPQHDANVISRLRDVVGPTDVDLARVERPKSIRGMFATTMVENAIHASSDVEEARKELLFFFPELVAAANGQASDKCVVILYDLSHTEELLERLKSAGIEILKQKPMYLSHAQADTLYRSESARPDYNEMLNQLVSGKCLVLLLKKAECVKAWADLMGPERPDDHKDAEASNNQQGLSSLWSSPDSLFPPLYGTRCDEEVDRDQELFFPLQRTLAIIKPDAFPMKDEILAKIEAAGFQTVGEMECTLAEEKVRSLYHEHEQATWFPEYINFLTSGPSLCLILQKEDAIQEWRQMIGPTDPQEARISHPHSLRALYGKDVMQNALHGSSSPEQADNRVHTAFPKKCLLPTVSEEDEDLVQNSGSSRGSSSVDVKQTEPANKAE